MMAALHHQVVYPEALSYPSRPYSSTVPKHSLNKVVDCFLSKSEFLEKLWSPGILAVISQEEFPTVIGDFDLIHLKDLA